MTLFSLHLCLVDSLKATCVLHHCRAEFWCFANRSSYPDRKEGEDAEMDDELPDDKNLEYDDETLELTLPSGDWRCFFLLAKVSSRKW